MNKKTNSRSSSGRIQRLVRCVRCLGVLNGYRYWRLQNRAIKDPDLIERCYDSWLSEADRCDNNGEYLTAGLIRAFAKEAREANQNFHFALRRGDLKRNQQIFSITPTETTSDVTAKANKQNNKTTKQHDRNQRPTY